MLSESKVHDNNSHVRCTEVITVEIRHKPKVVLLPDVDPGLGLVEQPTAAAAGGQQGRGAEDDGLVPRLLDVGI